jgi:hypothetical protein
MITRNIRLQKIAVQPVFARLKFCQGQATQFEDKVYAWFLKTAEVPAIAPNEIPVSANFPALEK